jgi:phage terminase large subunit-like protein
LRKGGSDGINRPALPPIFIGMVKSSVVYMKDALREEGRPGRSSTLEAIYDWSLHARPDQLPPNWRWFAWLLRGGRGSGKTRTGAEYVRKRVEEGSARRVAIIGQTKGDVRDTMIEVGASSLLAISPPWFMPKFESSKRRLTWPNGAIGIIYSGDEPGQLRGPQHDLAWMDEPAKFKYPQETWDNMEFGLRIGQDPRVVVTTTPRPIPMIRQLLADPKTADVRVSTYENIDNLSKAFIDRIKSKYEGTHLGRQELHGEVLEDNPGALWKRTELDADRVTKAPELERIVVAIDPEATATEDSAETGVIVAGIAKVGKEYHGYVLEDLTIKGTPEQWASQAVAGYHKSHADLIVAEVNNGGDMVGHTIKTIDGTLPFKALHATRGKFTRAEPISAMYEQHKIHHVGTFGELEDQLCDWVPGDTSPDRLDALVWAFTELLLNVNSAESWSEAFKIMRSKNEEAKNAG